MENQTQLFNLQEEDRGFFKKIFSFKGRVRRTYHWIAILCCNISLGLLEVIKSFPILLVIFTTAKWLIFAMGSKRCYDLNHNVWWRLIPLYPLWMALLYSQPCPNEYGPNPRGQLI